MFQGLGFRVVSGFGVYVCRVWGLRLRVVSGFGFSVSGFGVWGGSSFRVLGRQRCLPTFSVSAAGPAAEIAGFTAPMLPGKTISNNVFP